MSPVRSGDPAMRSSSAGTDSKVGSHGVPCTGQCVCETVETNLVMNTTHHIAPKIRN